MRGADETRYVHRGVAVDEAFPATGPPGAESERPPSVCVCNESLSISLSPLPSPASPASERASERARLGFSACVRALERLAKASLSLAALAQARPSLLRGPSSGLSPRMKPLLRASSSGLTPASARYRERERARAGKPSTPS